LTSRYTDAEAIRIANETSYGLTSGVLCRNLGRAMAIAHRIEAGMTHINDIPSVDMPQMPFGGEKNSGLGRFGSEGMIDAFTTQHWISIQHTEMPLPFWASRRWSPCETIRSLTVATELRSTIAHRGAADAVELREVTHRPAGRYRVRASRGDSLCAASRNPTR